MLCRCADRMADWLVPGCSRRRFDGSICDPQPPGLTPGRYKVNAMSLRVADRLKTARKRRFTGRTSELELFSSALDAADLPFLVLYIFGPAGVGKTTLLSEFGAICDERRVPCVKIDARNIEPMPDAFVRTLHQALNLPGESSLAGLVA